MSVRVFVRLVAVCFVSLASFFTVTALIMAGRNAWAGDRLLGSIVSAGASTNNMSTASPFGVNQADAGTQWFEVQCNAACYIAEGVGGATAATASNVQIQANQLFEERLVSPQDTIAILPVSGSAATCRVYAYTF